MGKWVVICAWCNKTIEVLEGPAYQDGTSHGCCEDCKRRILEESRRRIENENKK